MTYKELQSALKDIRSTGIELNCKLNAKKEILQAEYDRLTLVNKEEEIVDDFGYEDMTVEQLVNEAEAIVAEPIYQEDEPDVKPAVEKPVREGTHNGIGYRVYQNDRGYEVYTDSHAHYRLSGTHEELSELYPEYFPPTEKPSKASPISVKHTALKLCLISLYVLLYTITITKAVISKARYLYQIERKAARSQRTKAVKQHLSTAFILVASLITWQVREQLGTGYQVSKA